jgi:hypothetical protein
MADSDDFAEARAHALVTRILGLLNECRAILPELDAPTNKPEPSGAQAERHLYLALLAALEAELVRTVSDALAVPAPSEPAARANGGGVAGGAGAPAPAVELGVRARRKERCQQRGTHPKPHRPVFRPSRAETSRRRSRQRRRALLSSSSWLEGQTEFANVKRAPDYLAWQEEPAPPHT